MLDASDIARTVCLIFHISLCHPLLASLGKHCSPLGAAARSTCVRRRARLVDSFSLRVQLLYAYIWLLALEATAERSACVPQRALCQRLGVHTITSGLPYACGCAARAATRCSYVRHDGVTRCKLELPSGPADIPGRPASPLIPAAIITLVSSTFQSCPTTQQTHPRQHIERGYLAVLQWSSVSI